MPSSRKRYLVAIDSNGEPPKIRRKIETLKFTIHNFKKRKQRRVACVSSEKMRHSGGVCWIYVFPRGSNGSSTDVEQISCRLQCSNAYESKTSKVFFRCKRFTGCATYDRFYRFYYCDNFLERENVLENYLEDDGSLIIECDIDTGVVDKNVVWYPKELQHQETLVELYQDASSETSDVLFTVGETVYRAHKNILALKSKKLHELCNEYDSDTPIPICNVKGDVFKTILDFIYSVKKPKLENEEIAKDLLVAADRFECVHLKLYVESVIVDKFLSAGNAAGLWTLSDSHSCALLKEAARKILLDACDAARTGEDWSKIEDSKEILLELLKSMIHSDNRTVADMRQELENAGLEVDGSREVLVARLKAHRDGQPQP